MEFNKEKAQEWIDKHWRHSRNCPICMHNNWLLMTKIWQLPQFHQEGDTNLPVISLMCNVCGYTIFFNAIAVGLVERNE